MSPIPTSLVGTLIGSLDVTSTNLSVAYGNVAIGSAAGTRMLMDPTVGGWVSTFGNLDAGQFGQIGTSSNQGGVETAARSPTITTTALP